MLASIAVAGVVVASLPVFSAPARAGSPVEVTITITDIYEVDCDESPTCGNDYYVKTFMGGTEHVTPRAENDLTEVHPYWQTTQTFDSDLGSIPVRLQLWDFDDFDDDLIDIDGAGDRNLDITVDLATGNFTGEIPAPNVGYGSGIGDDSATILFTVSLGGGGDIDGDGIPDGVERFGVRNRQGQLVPGGDLAAIGSDPCRKTIAVEFDYLTAGDHTHKPTDAALAEMVASYANAPVPAVANCPYAGFPTAASGVNFIYTVDDAIPETAANSKIDWGNGAEGVRDANFDANLRPYMHYSLWVHNQTDTPGVNPGDPPIVNTSSGLCCGDQNKDVLVSLGSWAGQVGTTRDQSGTLMHELGHALGFGHGGVDTVNCKPNYQSLMSYVYQTTGIPDSTLPAATVDLNGDGTIDARDRLRLDYSRAQLPPLVEASLNEAAGIGGATADLFYWASDGKRPWRTAPANGAVDWDGSGAIDAVNVAADVNFLGIGVVGGQGCPSATPNDTLNGSNDWATIQYQAAMAGNGAGASPVSALDELDFATAQIIKAEVRAAVSTTDLNVSLTEATDPVAAGTSITYAVTVTNQGTNTAYASTVATTLSTSATFTAASAGCTHSAGAVTCALGDIAPGATVSRSITATIPANLVYVNGGPLIITSSSHVTHDGPDSDTSDDTSTQSTTVVARADLATVSATISGAPTEMLIGTPARFTLTRVVDNLGPSEPIDATLTTSGTATSGAGVVPSAPIAAVALVSARTVSQTVAVSCSAPGPHTFTLTAGIAPSNAADTDPVATNNAVSVSVTIDCVVPVAINIRPHHTDNRFSANTSNVDVALLTTRAGEYGLPLAFDATTAIFSTLRFGPSAVTFAGGGATDRKKQAKVKDMWERSDESVRDGDLDLEDVFVAGETGIPLGTSEACVKGRFTMGGVTYSFFGCDSITLH